MTEMLDEARLEHKQHVGAGAISVDVYCSSAHESVFIVAYRLNDMTILSVQMSVGKGTSSKG
ncbi:hypothetical protein ACTXT7_005163 [Hymenolepis weldensis]